MQFQVFKGLIEEPRGVNMKSYQTIADVLDAYAMQRGDWDAAEALLRVFPEHKRELRALFQIINRLQRALMPVKPALAFKRTLGQELLEAANRGRLPTITIRNPFRRQRILLGAAIGSAVSVAIGIIAAVLIHNKSAQRSHSAPSA